MTTTESYEETGLARHPGSIESRAIVDAVRGLASSLAEGVAENEAARRLPTESVQAIRRTRLPVLRVPAEYGGPGGTLRELVEAVILIATADPNLAQGLRSHFGFVERLLASVSADAERARGRWLPEVLSGKLFGLASAELGLVSTAEFTTTLRTLDDGSLVLDGRKYYSTGGLFADDIEVIANRGEGELVSLVIPAAREGVTMVDDFDGMGQRMTASGSTIFAGVRADPDEVIEVLDWNDPERRLDYLGGFYQLYLAAVSAGIAVNVFRDAADYVRQRARPAVHSLTGAAATDPYILQAVGEIGALAYGAEAVVLRAAESLDAAAVAAPGEEAVVFAAIDVAKAQLVAQRAAIEAGQRIFDTGGASTTSEKLNLSRHWRNARTIANHNPLAYKARATGDFAVNGAIPPRSGYF
jgi:alkylation response protein AidB-like acyl-CoA dehydrogenase